MAPQIAVAGSRRCSAARHVPSREDCLSLNVVTPAVRRRRPAGDGVDPRRRLHRRVGVDPVVPRHRARPADDVVVVTINYRLGVLGFCHLAELGEAYAGSGNCGILDQVAALRVGARQHRRLRR